ncbi:hypothetical protein [Mucilaginibacter aquatilis]|nr:hypothetical protein [Mucilaginibacter aquatilis]
MKARNLQKDYPALGQPIESENFVLVELKLKGKTIEYFHGEYGSDRSQELDTALQHLEPARYWPKNGGFVHYDTVKNQFMIATNEYVKNVKRPEGLLDEQKNICYFDESGKPVGQISNFYSIKQPWQANSVLMLDYVPNFPQWKNKSAELYLKHFEIEHFETYWLTPLRGMGSPNGAGPAPAWSGMAYYDLHIAGETLRFRSPATKDGFMFLESNDFETELAYCKFPRLLKKAAPAFLIYGPRFGQGRAFIIKHK